MQMVIECLLRVSKTRVQFPSTTERHTVERGFNKPFEATSPKVRQHKSVPKVAVEGGATA